MREGFRRWVSLPFRGRTGSERDVDDEIAHHVALRAERLQQSGKPPDEAYQEAFRRFGGARARDTLRGEARTREHIMLSREWFGDTLADVRFAFRQLARVPVFTATAITTIALGIGANVTMFGVVDRLLLQRPAHVQSPERVVSAAVVTQSGSRTRTQSVQSFPVFLDLSSDPSFEAVASYTTTSIAMGDGPAARELTAMNVTPAWFAVMGTRPLIGRFFDPAFSAVMPAINEVVVSEPFWRTQLDGSAASLGRLIELGGARYEVIGVAPRGFSGGSTTLPDVWLPYAAGATPARIAEWKGGRQWYSLRIVARLKDGVTPAYAAASASRAVQNGELRDGMTPDRLRQRNPSVQLTSLLPRDARGSSAQSRVALLLAAMSIVVLVLAGANVTNLQLGRATRRQREVSIRLALGVSRRRLVRLLLTESIVLAALGGLAAIAVAWWGTSLMYGTLLNNLQLPGAAVDLRMVGYGAAIALGLGLLTGFVPALQASRPDLITALRTGGQPAGSRGSARAVLLATQSALSLVLVIGTGLFVRSVQRIDALPLGLESDRVIVAQLNTTGRDYDDAALNTMYEDLARAMASTPGVEHAAVTLSLPFGASTGAPVFVPGLDSVPVTSEGGPYVSPVGTDYFRTLGTPIVRGRDFTSDDRRGSPPVAIVNETAARLWWPGEDAIGKCVRVAEPGAACATVIGIVTNTRRQSIIEDEFVQVFLPAPQTDWANPRTVIARVRGDAQVAATEVQRSLLSAGGLPYVQTSPLNDRLSAQTRSWRLGATMFGIFGLLSIVIAAVGLYGVLAFDVSQRLREIGVRLALGGSPRAIAVSIVRRGVMLAGIGCLVGLTVTFIAGKRIEPLLFQTSPLEPLVYGVALLVILATAVLASWLPARRAGKVDPLLALRSD